MKILVAGSVNEYSCYEEEQLIKFMVEELKKKGHRVDFFLLPYKADALSLLDQVLAYSLIEVNDAELLITIGYPACFIKHPNKLCYLLETAPMLHEYWNSEYGTEYNYQYSQIITALDGAEKKCFTGAKRVFCDSTLLCEDILKRTGIKPELLFLPFFEGKEVCAERIAGKYFIVETNLLQNSRYHEFLEQLPQLENQKICICIPNADPIYFHAFEEQIKRLKLCEKVVIINGSASNELLKNASGYLQFCFKSRRMDGVVSRCMALGIPVILADDCGVALEYVAGYDGVEIVCFNQIVRFLVNYHPNKHFDIHKFDIANFTEKVIEGL